ncbi:MAG TPA: methyltransferase domain-containing protein [Solirubrobacter sp.]|nr:methyltransferase domain-containing protein [Solirubrobacter sp.]
MDFPPGFFDLVAPAHPAPGAADEAALRDLYSDLDIDGRVLDLCGSSPEHFDVPPDELVALAGDPSAPLPFGDAAFDAALCGACTGALTAPDATFAEVARILRPGGRLVCTFTGGFDEPAVRGWAAADDAGRVRIVRAYFARAEAFGPAESDLRTSLTGVGERLWAVWAAKRG